ncbi:MAG: hypothetical protein LBF16_07365 [Pseudomonadales bacterium]|jgi:uncharacterized membrane protein YbaN (DUF454 family)|nr:hypothetical protein [Pseudomonadales bacterium]
MNHERYDRYLYGSGSSGSERARPGAGSGPAHWFEKVLALLFLGLCLVLGVLGAVLPLFPALVFFGFAALTAAWLCPPLRRVLLRHPQLVPYFDATDGLTALPWRRRLRVLAWVTLKFVVDSFRLSLEALARVIAFARRSRP